MVIDSTYLKRLSTAMTWSREEQEVYRTNRLKFIKAIAGAHYSNNGSDFRNPNNIAELIYTTYRTLLTGGTPQVTIGTTNPELREISLRFELALNHLMENEIGLRETLKRVVCEALVSPYAMVKTGICGGYGTIELEGVTHDIGQAYCDIINFDDSITDMQAVAWDQLQYAGNRYRLPFEKAMDAGYFKGKAREGLKPNTYSGSNEQGDERGETISRGTRGLSADRGVYDMIELWDLWLPAENCVITVQAEEYGSGIHEKVLREIEWTGPERGPYQRLVFGMLPGQLMGLPPAALWFDLHEAVNMAARKLFDQAERQRTIGMYSAQAADDADRVNKTRDGDYVQVNHLGQVQESSVGGISQPTMAYMIDSEQRALRNAGNVESLAGLGPQAETAKQDAMLGESASKRIYDMQQDVRDFTVEVCRALAHYTHTDPVREYPIVKRVGSLSLQSSYSPEDRAQGRWEEFRLSLTPHSLQYQSPTEKMQAIDFAFEKIVKLASLGPQTGIIPNVQGYLELLKRFGRIENLDELYQVMDESSPPMQPEPPGMPANTSREYIRTNRPGGTRAGQDAARIQALLGQQQQPAEAVAALRGVG